MKDFCIKAISDEDTKEFGRWAMGNEIPRSAEYLYTEGGYYGCMDGEVTYNAFPFAMDIYDSFNEFIYLKNLEEVLK